MTESADTPPNPSPLARLYLACMACTVFGTALGFLAMTGASTLAGGPAHAGIYTALVTSVVALASAWGTARTPQACRRRGALWLLAASQATLALVLVVGGILLTAGAPIMPVLLAVALPMGFASGVVAVLSPGFSRAFLGSASTTEAYARAGMVAGLAYAAGSLAGGFLLQSRHLGFGLIANGILAVPLLLLLRRIDPADAPPSPTSRKGAWASAREGMAASGVLRLVGLLALFIGLFVLPFQSLVTPVVSSLRPSANLMGAGAVLAGLSLGLMVSPRVVKMLARGRGVVVAMVMAALAAGGFILVFGMAGALPVGPAQIILMIAVAFGVGAFRQAYISIRAGVASDVRGGEHGLEDLATVTLIGRAVMPIGMIVWGVALDLGSTPAVLVVAGALMVVIALALLGRARRVGGVVDEGVAVS